MVPGEYILAEGAIVANAGRRTVELLVENTGDRPIQVGSHFHFFEVNRALRFDRTLAFGMRLNIPAGTAVRCQKRWWPRRRHGRCRSSRSAAKCGSSRSPRRCTRGSSTRC